MAEISVIIPVYKVEKYIDKCLESVCNQTFTDLEIILVDDGSPDNCPQICDDWANKDSRIKVIHKNNGGLSSARNEGIRHATGKYIGFVDSDDWIMLDMYETLYKLFNSGDYDIASVGVVRIKDENYSPLIQDETISVYTSKQFIKRLLKVGTQDSDQYAWNKLYRRKILTDNIYPEGLTDEDVEGTLKAVLNSGKSIICSNKELYLYRINDESITSLKYNSTKTDFLKICDHVVNIISDTKDEEMIYWSHMFRYRADFAVLSRLVIMQIDDKYVDEVRELERKLISALRRNYWSLLKFDWPISRKIVMTLFCINYNAFKCVYKTLKRG